MTARKHPHEYFQEDADLRQRNTIWPDTVRNAAKVDGFLWKGSPSATKVQRVGAFIFGILLLLAAAMLVGIAFVDGYVGLPSIGLIVIAVGVIYLGCRLIRNAFLHRAR
jgi:hypothetical protein